MTYLGADNDARPPSRVTQAGAFDFVAAAAKPAGGRAPRAVAWDRLAAHLTPRPEPQKSAPVSRPTRRELAEELGHLDDTLLKQTSSAAEATRAMAAIARKLFDYADAEGGTCVNP